MPRARKNQPNVVGARQAYGAGEDQRKAQRAIPLPNMRQPLGPVSTNSPTVVPAAVPAVAPPAPDPMQMALDMAPSPNLLMQPSTRPHEPVTTGLSRGPGAGPSAQSGPNLSSMLQQISDATGDPYYAQLAQRIT